MINMATKLKDILLKGIKAESNMFDNIVVVGQGAIGLLWYHHLSQSMYISKKEISLLSSKRSAFIQNKNEAQQYRFTGYQQKHSQSFKLIDCTSKAIQKANVIILCLKSYNIAEAIEQIAPNLSINCVVILAHNGMGTFEDVKKLLPDDQTILAMITTHGCIRHSALTITHTGLGKSDIGLLSGKLQPDQQENLTAILNKALPTVEFHQNITEKQWLKLAINSVINPLTAVNNIDNGLINTPKFDTQINKILDEVVKVSGAENIELNVEELQTQVTRVAKNTAKNCSSMRSDVLAGNPTEIDYINGYIHRLGKKHHIATPENTKMWQQVKNLKLQA